MPRDLEFWYGLSPGLRALTASLLVLLALAFCWCMVIRPIEAEQFSLEAQRQAQQQPRQLRWKTLMNLRPPDVSASEEKVTAFTPLSFQSLGRELIRWQPTAGGGEMVLASTWDAVPPTFLHLAERNMLAVGFSLAMKENALHFTLLLERGEGG